jgi:hypothetical protein
MNVEVVGKYWTISYSLPGETERYTSSALVDEHTVLAYLARLERIGARDVHIAETLLTTTSVTVTAMQLVTRDRRRREREERRDP